jgi:hypothetical protein
MLNMKEQGRQTNDSIRPIISPHSFDKDDGTGFRGGVDMSSMESSGKGTSWKIKTCNTTPRLKISAGNEYLSMGKTKWGLKRMWMSDGKNGSPFSTSGATNPLYRSKPLKNKKEG